MPPHRCNILQLDQCRGKLQQPWRPHPLESASEALWPWFFDDGNQTLTLTSLILIAIVIILFCILLALAIIHVRRKHQEYTAEAENDEALPPYTDEVLPAYRDDFEDGVSELDDEARVIDEKC